MDEKMTTDIIMGGKEFHLVADDPEYLQRLVTFVNRKIFEIKGTPGYAKLSEDYKNALLCINLADEYFNRESEIEKLKVDVKNNEDELYTLRHDLVTSKLKLENALKEQEILEKRIDELKGILNSHGLSVNED